MTLGGTNSYVVGRDPAYVIDPGPRIPAHLEAIRKEAELRGGLGGVLLTHSHADHSEGAVSLGAELLWGEPTTRDEAAALAAAQAHLHDQLIACADDSPATEAGASDVAPLANTAAGPRPGTVGPFTTLPTPGHASDHVAFLIGDVCFCGDLILGEGSSIVPPEAGGGSLSAYMASLGRLAELELVLLCPGHGPWITEPKAKIAEYVNHRLDRERTLRAALVGGERSRAKLLDTAWDDVPSNLRPAAALAMQAHLEKLAAEGMELPKLRD